MTKFSKRFSVKNIYRFVLIFIFAIFITSIFSVNVKAATNTIYAGNTATGTGDGSTQANQMAYDSISSSGTPLVQDTTIYLDESIVTNSTMYVNPNANGGNITVTYLNNGSSTVTAGSSAPSAMFSISGASKPTDILTINASAITFSGNNTQNNFLNGTMTTTSLHLNGGTYTQFIRSAFILSGTNVTAIGTNFNNNATTLNGAAIYDLGGSDINVSDCYFDTNTATGNGGALYSASGTSAIKITDAANPYSSYTSTTFTGNKSANGGAIYSTAGNVQDTSVATLYTGNSATTGNGGAVYVAGSTGILDLTGSTFNGNTATAGDGGAVYVTAGTKVTLSTASFDSNIALSGGAVYDDNNAGAILYLGGASFTNNKATAGDGGAIYATVVAGIQKTSVGVAAPTFSGNTTSNATATWTLPTNTVYSRDLGNPSTFPATANIINTNTNSVYIAPNGTFSSTFKNAYNNADINFKVTNCVVTFYDGYTGSLPGTALSTGIDPLYSQTIVEGEAVVKPNITPTRTDYLFKSWNTPVASMVTTAATVSNYALWTANPSLKAYSTTLSIASGTLDNTGGAVTGTDKGTAAISMTNIGTTTITGISTASEPIELKAVPTAGYYLAGWYEYTTTTGVLTKLTSGTTTTQTIDFKMPAGDTTICADFEPNASITAAVTGTTSNTITLAAEKPVPSNDNSSFTGNTASVSPITKILVTESVPSGKVFTGWTLSSGITITSGTTTTSTIIVSIANGTTTGTITANYVAGVVLNFSGINGSVTATDTTTNATITSGSCVIAGDSVKLNVTPISNSTFNAWNESTGNGVIGANAQVNPLTFTMPATETTILADCTKNNSSGYSVTFISDGQQLLSYTLNAGNSVNQTPIIPTKVGYTFNGWIDGSGNIYTSNSVYNVVISADTTFTASFILNSSSNNSETTTDGSNAAIAPSPNNSSTSTPIVKAQMYISGSKVSGGFVSLDSSSHVAYISGYKNGTIRPDASTTRAEVAEIFYTLVKNQDKSPLAPVNYSDVNADAWYKQAIDYFSSVGILSGYPDGSFKPDAPITRAEFATVVSKFISKSNSLSKSIPDVSNDFWAHDYIASVFGNKLMTGYKDNNFYPMKDITRAEVASVINRMLNRSIDTNALTADVKNFTDLSPNHWAYADMIDASTQY